MNLYEAFRHFADSWALLALTLVFLAIVLWAYRPGSRTAYRGQAAIPFKYDQEDAHRE